MSTITHKPQTLPAHLHRKAAAWLAAAILVAAVAIMLALALNGSNSEQTVPAANPGKAPHTMRYDSGPERRDGGAQKGTRGPAPCCGQRP